VNSEAVISDDHAVRFSYESNGNKVIKFSEQSLLNTYVEGEGAAAAQVAKNHLDDNCLVISNNTDSLLYAMLAALPEEVILQNHCRRVTGAYKFMSNYMQDTPTKVDWEQYGYHFDIETQCFSPIIIKQQSINKVPPDKK